MFREASEKLTMMIGEVRATITFPRRAASRTPLELFAEAGLGH